MMIMQHEIFEKILNIAANDIFLVFIYLLFSYEKKHFIH
jgi:hypothetical protein